MRFSNKQILKNSLLVFNIILSMRAGGPAAAYKHNYTLRVHALIPHKARWICAVRNARARAHILFRADQQKPFCRKSIAES